MFSDTIRDLKVTSMFLSTFTKDVLLMRIVGVWHLKADVRLPRHVDPEKKKKKGKHLMQIQNSQG